MRTPPCPSYDVPSREDLRREEMDEAKSEAYDEGHEAGTHAGQREVIDDVIRAIKAYLLTPAGRSASRHLYARDTCDAILEYLSDRYDEVPRIELDEDGRVVLEAK